MPLGFARAKKSPQDSSCDEAALHLAACMPLGFARHRRVLRTLFVMKQLSTSRLACRSDSPGTEESSGLFCVLAHPPLEAGYPGVCGEAEFFADVRGALVKHVEIDHRGAFERDGHDVAVVHFR